MTGNGLASRNGHDAAIGDTVIEEAATEIRRYAGRAMLEFAWTVGKVVLERFYGGDIEAFHAHGRKDVSLRRLAERLGEPHLSASSLHRFVAIHAALVPLGSVDQWRRLTPTHVSLVLPLPASEQALLLREAEAKDWSVRELDQVARVNRPVARRGRPSVPAFVRAVRTIVRMTETDGEAFAELDRVASLDPKALLELNQLVMRGRENLERLQRALSPKRLGVMRPSRGAPMPIRDRGRPCPGTSGAPSPGVFQR